MTHNSRLLIISHTEHFLNEQGEACGWIPTVRELDFLAGHFKEVVHLAVLRPGNPPQSTTAYSAKNITFFHIPPFGGAGIKNKLNILWVVPRLLFKLSKALHHADLFQFRAPTSIGLFVIPYLSLFSRKPGWYKYAGNWVQPNMPLSYRIQKWMLEKGQRRAVTINGQWPNQKSHVKTFENPCLSAIELPGFVAQASLKKWQMPYDACFVGRLDDAKGVHRIVKLLLSPGIEELISTFHFVGSGEKLESYQNELKASKVKTIFHGFLGREEIFKIYASSHLFLLPSNSEGFPKVVAEAAAFSCVPVVSDVSSIGQYVNESNGYLWPIDKIDFVDFFLAQDFSEYLLRTKGKACLGLAERFTFEHFYKKLTQIVQ
jgi:glycosyltransferase involved in cell wall biosynthesis